MIKNSKCLKMCVWLKNELLTIIIFSRLLPLSIIFFSFFFCEAWENITRQNKMRPIIFLSSSILFCVTCEQLSKLFQLVKPNKAVVDSQPIRVERKDSIVQCLMELVTLYSYFLEIQMTDSNRYICKMFQGKIEDYKLVSNSKSNIYGETSNLKNPTDQQPIKNRLCQDHQSTSNQNGVFDISPVNQTLNVYCDMKKEGGGWTTIQRRVDGSVSFQRDWADYKKGFGDPAGNYWLGLDNIHAITNTFANVMLRIEASTFDGERAVVIFEGFKVDNEAHLYKLTCGKVVDDSLPLSDGWFFSDGMSFSTRDRDNDLSSSGDCSNVWGGSGGMWFNKCAFFHVNSKYPSFPGEEKIGIIQLKSWKGLFGMKSISMAIKVYG